MIRFNDLSPEAQRAIDDYIISELEISPDVEWGIGYVWRLAGKTLTQLREDLTPDADEILKNFQMKGPRSFAFRNPKPPLNDPSL
jgi:hypothetical protein